MRLCRDVWDKVGEYKYACKTGENINVRARTCRRVVKDYIMQPKGKRKKTTGNKESGNPGSNMTAPQE